MLLPKSRLDSLEFYTYQREHPSFKLAVEDVITLYWKEWWRPRTKIRSPLQCVAGNYKSSTWRSSAEIVELLDQLRHHCRSN